MSLKSKWWHYNRFGEDRAKINKAVTATALTFLILLASANACFADANFDAGVRYYQQKNYSAASECFKRALKSDATNPTIYYYSGLCYQQLGDNEHAKQFYTFLSANFPNTREAALVAPVLKALADQHSPGRMASNASTVGVLNASSKTSAQLSDEEWKKLPDEDRVPFVRGTSSHQFVDGYINGRPMHMMFDTGAEMCCIARSDLEGLGLRLDANAPTAAVSGVGGSAGAHVINADMTIGHITRKVPIYVFDKSLGYPIVGESFFKEFNYEIDNSRGSINFRKKPRAGMVSHVYESTDVIAIPYTPRGNNMIVNVKVNGTTVPMIFDTGSFAICFSALSAAALGLHVPGDAKVMATSGAGGSTQAYSFPCDRIELGPIIKSHIPIVVNQATTPMLPLLGQPFFADRKYTIDTENHLIKFAH